MTKPVRTCETPGCEGKHKARGLCRACYLSWRKQQRVLGTCKVSDCDKPVDCRGLCTACYSWLKRHGEIPTTANRIPPKKEFCETPGCDKKHVARGMCHACYKHWQKYGEKPETADRCTRYLPGELCKVSDCDKPPKARGMCNTCYGWWRTHGEIPEIADRRRVKGTCKVSDCDKPHYAHGLCSACHQWRLRYGEIPETADRRRVKGTCETPECDKPHKARGLCENCYQRWLRTQPGRKCTVSGCGKKHVARGMCGGCYSWWVKYGEIPESTNRAMTDPMIHHTEIVDLNLTADEREQVWILGRHQSQMYNLGVEIALHAIDLGVPVPSNYTANKDVLTPGRKIGTIPKHSRALQQAGLRQGLEPVRRYRSQTGKYRAHLEYLSEDITKAKKRGDSKRLEKLERWHARTEQKLAKLEDKGRDRFYQKRKNAIRGNMPALVFDEAVKISKTHLKLPGSGLRLKFRKPFAVPEGYMTTGAVQIVDAGRKYTRRTELCHRRFRAHIHLKKVAPVPRPPEAEDDLLGIDLGIVIPVCTSTGKQIYLKDDEQEKKLFAHIKYLNRCMAKHDPGSRRHKKQVQRFRKAHRKRANRRKNASRHAAKEVTDHAQKQDCVMVVAEDLNHKGMRASAKGTIEHPGRSVAAKRGLNSLLRRAAMGRLQDGIERRCLRKGIDYIKVPPHGTSQLCNACGAKGGRETQAVFLCSHCGWFGNADHNAARNIRAKGWAAVGDTVDRRFGVTNKQPVQQALHMPEPASSPRWESAWQLASSPRHFEEVGSLQSEQLALGL